MKMTKPDRHARILDLIEREPIGTQEDLVERLSAGGALVTQATVSRDIKELGLIKVTGPGGIQRYVQMERGGEADTTRLMKVFAEAVLSCDRSGQLVVVRTLPGMAPASASALDSMRLPDVVGTLAGDDTVFVATTGDAAARSLTQRLQGMLRST